MVFLFVWFSGAYSMYEPLDWFLEGLVMFTHFIISTKHKSIEGKKPTRKANSSSSVPLVAHYGQKTISCFLKALKKTNKQTNKSLYLYLHESRG